MTTEIKDAKTAPNPHNGIYNPTIEQLIPDGFRVMPELPPIADGYTRLSIKAVEDDGYNGKWEVIDKLTSEIEAEAKAARLADFTAKGLVPKAQKFRLLLRAYFGSNAETNHDITAEVVANYFLTTSGLSVENVQHGIALEKLFQELSTWNGTVETWTLPWESIGAMT
jgi:hypothetical protein